METRPCLLHDHGAVVPQFHYAGAGQVQLFEAGAPAAEREDGCVRWFRVARAAPTNSAVKVCLHGFRRASPVVECLAALPRAREGHSIFAHGVAAHRAHLWPKGSPHPFG